MEGVIAHESMAPDKELNKAEEIDKKFLPREKHTNCLFRDHLHTYNIIETSLDIFYTSLKILVLFDFI